MAVDKEQIAINKVSKIAGDNNMRATFAFETVLHTKTKNLNYSEGVFVTELCINRDYENNVGDVIEIKISIPLGTFIEDVYPFMENCELTLRVRKQFSKGTGTNVKPIVASNRYKVIYLKDKNADIPNNKIYAKSDMNQMLPTMITLQLIDRAVEAVRIKTTGGNINVGGSKGASVALHAILSSECNMILIEGKPALDSITVYKEDSKTPIKYVAVPSYTRIIEIPDYIQEKMVGMYNTGVGCYIQRYMKAPGEYKTGMWVYPLYNTTKDKSKVMSVKLNAVSTTAAAATLPGLVYESGDFLGLCLKPKVQETDKEATVMSSGTGFRLADATKMMGKPVTIHKKGPIFDRSTLNTEVIYKEREDCMNFAVNKGIYYNNLALASEVAKKRASFLTIEIPNLDHDTIRPCMILNILSTGADNDKKGLAANKPRNFNCNILQANITYSNNNHSVIFSRNNKYTELTSHAVIRACYQIAT